MVGDLVDERVVILVTDRSDDRNLGLGDSATELLVAERQQLSGISPASSKDDNVDVVDSEQLGERRLDGYRSARATDRARLHEERVARKARRHDGADVVQDRGLGAAQHADAAWEQRQWAPRTIEHTVLSQPAAGRFDRRRNGALADRRHVDRLQVHLARRRLPDERTGDPHPLASDDLTVAGDAGRNSDGDRRRSVLQREERRTRIRLRPVHLAVDLDTTDGPEPACDLGGETNECVPPRRRVLPGLVGSEQLGRGLGSHRQRRYRPPATSERDCST